MIAGFDEAGRGSLIGPLVTSLVIFDKKSSFEEFLRDSKKLTKKRREELFEKIKEGYVFFYEKISPKDIDRYSLNKLEERALLKLVKKAKEKFSIDKVFVDKFSYSIPSQIEGIKIISEHKADDKYKVVSAASIVAKVIRDREIEKIKGKTGDFGSGYPSDIKTREFVNENWEVIEKYVRKKWKTVRKEKSITEFF